MSSLMIISPEEKVKFLTALENVYGNFEPKNLPTKELATWTPPPLAEGHRGRYLWTDAFGVINFVSLYKITLSQRYLTLASRLISSVHEVLGRTRDGKARLPGATDSHPLSGGLRIGKEDEFGPEGDGQYHHYITLWMFALNRYSTAAEDPSFNTLAIELAKTIHPAFMTHRDEERPRMHWKLSADLKDVLVGTEGNLDPFQGYTVFNLLNETAGRGHLEQEIKEYKKIVEAKYGAYDSEDPLDLGMTLWIAQWNANEKWAHVLKEGALEALKSLEEDKEFDVDIGHRLAFRELGSVHGLKCNEDSATPYWHTWINKIMKTWEESGQVPIPQGSVMAHPRLKKLAPITLVMYCAAIYPGAFKKGFLEN